MFLVALAGILVSLQPCSGLPVDPRQQVMRLLEKGNRENLAKYDLCLICEVSCITLHEERASVKIREPCVGSSFLCVSRELLRLSRRI